MRERDGGVYFEAEDFGLGQRERFSVDFDQSFALLFFGETRVRVPVARCPFFRASIRLTLQCATAVADRTIDVSLLSFILSFFFFSARDGWEKSDSLPVFFLPKHCTLCVEDMMGGYRWRIAQMLVVRELVLRSLQNS